MSPAVVVWKILTPVVIAQCLNGCVPYLGILALCSIPQMSLGFGYLAPAKKKATELELRLAGIFVLRDSCKAYETLIERL